MILQVVYGKNCYSGSHAVRLATNHRVGCTQYIMIGTLLVDVVYFEARCLKSLLNLFFTHVSKVDKSIYVTYFLQKRHSHKVKSKFSRWIISPSINNAGEKFAHTTWGEICPHHLGRNLPTPPGKIHPFCLPVTFNTSLTET